MLELYSGQLPLEELKYNMSHKEAILLRESRVERLMKQKKEMENEKAKEVARQKREQVRSNILKK